MCKQDDNDNVYINLSIAQQMIDDLCEKDRKTVPIQCQCGSKKFTTDGEKFTCSGCGEIFDPDPELSEPGPESTS
jgi:DNA-directed RNA polymerase subunit RPC12/RpoP